MGAAMTSRSDRSDHSETLGALFAALSAFQGEVANVQKDGKNPHLRNRYTTLDALQEATRPIMARHGLAITQCVSTDGDRVAVRTMLGHASGEWVASTCAAEVREEKGLKIAQVMGSIVSYLRRYAWQAALGVSSTDEDDDGSSGPRERRAPTTPPTLEEALAGHGLTLAGFDTWATAKGQPPAADLSPERRAKAAQWVASGAGADAIRDAIEAGERFRRLLHTTLTRLGAQRPTLDGVGGCGGDREAWAAAKARHEAAYRMLLDEWYGVASSKELTAAHAAGPYGVEWLRGEGNVAAAWGDLWAAAGDMVDNEGGAK